MKHTILVVDDNQDLQERLREYLTEFGYSVIPDLTGEQIAETITTHQPDLIILDVMLPGRDGMDILKEIRHIGNVPVLMLTARGEETDRILGLELGADDYLSKPFNPRELLARIKAIMRRLAENSSPDVHQINKKNGAKTETMRLDDARHLLVYGNRSTQLSSTEFRLLEVMMQRPDTIISRSRFMELVHDRGFEAFDRSIDVHISRIRSKLEQISGNRGWIRTYRGSGYMFVSKP